MFDRRFEKPIFRRVTDLFWPRIGIKRTLRYHWLRLVHHPASSKNLAAGFATGAAISCTPFVGLHLIITFAICILFRLNLWSAALGTTLGNPWTFPFIWAFIYFIGNSFLPLSESSFNIASLSWSALMENPTAIFLPMLIGGIPLSLFVWFSTYKVLSFILKKHKEDKNNKGKK